MTESTPRRDERIVVGVDGSAGAAAALRWAVEEGRLHDWPVQAVLTWTYLEQYHAGEERFDPHYADAEAAAALDAAVRAALGDSQWQEVERTAVCDTKANGLLDAAAGAALLVVGSRGLGGFTGALLGSVSNHVVNHATGPVAVVRPPAHDKPTGRVVVGVDSGSANSRRALDWAVREARVRNAALDVVHAWHSPVLEMTMAIRGGVVDASGIDPTAFETAAGGVVDAMLASTDTTGVPVERVLAPGGAAPVLLDAAKGADLVVVGSRGLGGFRGLLLGSVSHQVIHHAVCPVVVVPPATEDMSQTKEFGDDLQFGGPFVAALSALTVRKW